MTRALSGSIVLLAASLLASGRALPQFTPDESELRSVIHGASATFPSGAVGVWGASGEYIYRLSGGGRVLRGRYTISRGRVCVDLLNHYGPVVGVGWAMESCFLMTRHEGRYMLLNHKGQSVPLRVSHMEAARQGQLR